MELDTIAGRLATKQHGLVTRKQILRAGGSASVCHRRLQRDLWVPVHAGVYRLAGAPETQEQKIAAACLAVGGVASHRAAATVLGLPDIDPMVEVTVPHARRVGDLEGVRIHRVVRLDSVDRGYWNGIPTTSMTRTLIDLSGVLPGAAVVALADHVLAKRLVRLEYLAKRLEALGTQGRGGAGRMAGIVADRLGRTRFADSEPQRLLIRIVTEAGLPLPEIEFAIQLPNGDWRFVDAAWVVQRLIVEVNSYTYHSDLDAWARDQERNNELMALGWGVVPITPRRLERDPAGVADLIGRMLGMTPRAC